MHYDNLPLKHITTNKAGSEGYGYRLQYRSLGLRWEMMWIAINFHSCLLNNKDPFTFSIKVCGFEHNSTNGNKT